MRGDALPYGASLGGLLADGSMGQSSPCCTGRAIHRRAVSGRRSPYRRPLRATCGVGPSPPAGFTPLFDGRDLTGWYGKNPHAVATLTGEKRDEMLAKMRQEFASFWRVERGELVNDGQGPYATTDRELGDAEFLVEYKTVPKADSGIYLRGLPQRMGRTLGGAAWGGVPNRAGTLLGCCRPPGAPNSQERRIVEPARAGL